MALNTQSEDNLNQFVPIVDTKTGAPSMYFIRYIQNRGGALSTLDAAIVEVQALVDALSATSITSADGSITVTNPTLADDVDLSVDEQVVLDAISSTQGTILYRGASSWAALAVGTAGQVLNTNGAGADPTWEDAASGGGGGSQVLIAELAADGTTSELDATSLDLSSYDKIEIICDIRGETTGDSFKVQFNGDTGSNYYMLRDIHASTGHTTSEQLAQTGIWVGFSPDSSDLAGRSSQSLMTIANPGGSTFDKTVIGASFRSVSNSTAAGTAFYSWGGVWDNTAAITRIRVYMSDGTDFESGSTIKIVGYTSTASGANAHRGALVKLSTDATGVDYSTSAAIPWDAEEYDTDTIHDNSTNNSRLSVPAGITKVKISFSVLASSVTSGTDVYLSVYKNGSQLGIGVPITAVDASATISPRLAGTSTVLEVVGGTDYFDLRLQTGGDSSINLSSANSWFAMEIIE